MHFDLAEIQAFLLIQRLTLLNNIVRTNGKLAEPQETGF
jgi:hypothetical protein